MIKKLSIISIFGILSFSALQAQTTVYAYLKDAQGKPVENAEVDLRDSDNDVTADKIGYFQFVDMKPGHYSITISKPGFEHKIIEFDVNANEKKKDLGSISLAPSLDMADLGVITIDDSDTQDSDNGSVQPTVGLLSSGRDAFANAAAFELGAYWFRPRGVDNRFEDILFNGVSMSKNDDGRVDFSNWGGLNDVTRYPLENVENITPSEFTFGNLGGVTYYNTRASSYRKGASLAYSFTNRSYFHRAMATYNSGLNKKGWAYSISASRRWAEEGVIEGTYQDAYAYFLSVEKRLGERHALNFTAFGSPTYRGSNSPNTQEVYDLAGKNYNSYWGWQDGEKRNSRIRKVFEPVFQMAHYWKIGKSSNLNSTFSYQQGEDARSRLDWFHATDPNPTYYRKLPSYVFAPATYDTSDGGYSITDVELAAYSPLYNDAVNNWRQDKAGQQIDWNHLYDVNLRNLEIGARYTMVEDVNRDKTLNFVSHFDTRLKDNWKLNVNFNYQNLRSDNFRRIKDLLGAAYANNLDAFGGDKPFNVDGASTRVYEGDRTQYSYLLNRDVAALNISTELDLKRWNFVLSGFSSYSESFRDGHYRNHFYLNNSKGKSDVYDSQDYGVKGKLTYKINGRNFLVANGAYFTLAPTLNEIFINPRVNDFVTPNLENQQITSSDFSYITRGQVLKLRLTGYYTSIKNSTEISRYFAEGIQLGTDATAQDAFVAEILSGIDKKYMGAEFAADVKISPTLTSVLVVSYGDYTINNNPTAYVSIDSDLYPNGYDEIGTAKLKGNKIAGTPQKAASLSFRYNSPKYWWFGMSANYLMDQYLDFSALNRTPNFYTDPTTGDNYIHPITGEVVTQSDVDALNKQKKFDDQFMLNANVGKSFLLGKYRMGLSLSVNNILNNRDYVTGGFEQGRKSNFTESYVDNVISPVSLFGPKLWYDRGTTFFANVYLRF